MTIQTRVRIVGARETQAALERLALESPAGARRAINRTIGVARQRVIKALSRLTGIPRTVLGGKKSRGRGASRVKGRGYVKQVRASRSRSEGALVVLTQGVRFSRIGRKTLGRSQRKPGGLGEPFRARMPSGFDSLFERVYPQTKVGPDRRPRKSSASRASIPTITIGRTNRPNLPIREVVIPLEPHASRAARTLMRRAARTVLPAKVWEELNKSIRR